MKRKAQARVDEFVWILFGGLVIIMVLLFAFGTQPTTEENVTTGVTTITGEFSIGEVKEDVSRSIRIGSFGVSFVVGPNVLAEEDDIEVSRSLLSSKNFKFSGRIEEDLSLVTSGFLTIDVLDTNSLGNLQVKINDETIFNQKVSSGQINIPISNNLLKSFNVIEISSSGPGLMFWATSFYKIDHVEFGINIFGKSEKTQSFAVTRGELENFKLGEVIFSVLERQGSGDLIIRINNRIVFKGIPSGTFRQSFDAFDVGLATEANTIIFSTESGTAYRIDNAELIIIHESESKKSRSFNLVLSESDLNRLSGTDKGIIKFFVVNSNQLGSLKITITDSTGVTREIATLIDLTAGRTRKVSFDDSEVKTGTNLVTFEAVDQGSYTLSNLEFLT